MDILLLSLFQSMAEGYYVETESIRKNKLK